MALFKSSIFSLLLLLISQSAIAVTITHQATPGQVPDAQQPKLNYGDAPTGYGPDSWENTDFQNSSGNDDKVNWHARYQADGNYLSVLFPDDAAAMTINDLKSISYFTKRPSGTTAGHDWWIQIYTRPKSGNSSWFQERFINNYNDHTNIGDWTEYSTDSDMTFNHNGTKVGTSDNNGEMTLAQLKTNYGDELIEMISVQTDSGWGDTGAFSGYMDGLEIELMNGNIGKVDFVIPEPTTAAVLGLAGLGLIARRRRRVA